MHAQARRLCNHQELRGLRHLCGRSQRVRVWRDNLPFVPSFRRGRILPRGSPNRGRRVPAPRYLRGRVFHCVRRVRPSPGSRFIEVPSVLDSPSWHGRERGRDLPGACVRVAGRGPCIRLRVVEWWRRVWLLRRLNNSGGRPTSAARVRSATGSRSRKRKFYAQYGAKRRPDRRRSTARSPSRKASP